MIALPEACCYGSPMTERQCLSDSVTVEETSSSRGGSHQARLGAWRQELKRDRAAYVRQESRWSWARLVTFLTSGVVIAAVTFWYNLLLAAVVAVPILLAFRHTVLRHLDWKTQRTKADRMLIVIDESLHDAVGRKRPARRGDRPDDPADPAVVLPTLIDEGSTWALSDQERDDLDLYAPPLGIFGRLNYTSTSQGARRLRNMLDNPCLERESIQRRQAAVAWLAEHDEQRIGIMASVLPLRRQSESLDALARQLRETTLNPHTRASLALRIWSAFSGLFFLHAVFRVFEGQFLWVRALILLLVVNAVILHLVRQMLGRLNDSVLPLVRLAPALRGFLAAARCASESLPEETSLGILRGHLARVAAEGEIPSLCERLGWMGLGGAARGLLNVIVFYDLHVAEAILSRFVSGRTILLEGLAALAEFEALASLACFSASQAVKCYPSFVANVTLDIDEGRHPLIPTDVATANGVRLTSDQRMGVITGPNAAGKSTYLRMAGVNLLLAQIGSAVCARHMTLCPLRLLTDVRIRDDLAKNESYFLSEVRRLRRMLTDAEARTPLLGLIDEPFRGTNSSERTAAGVALVEYVLGCGHLFLLATHEETLARTAAASDAAENYHFQEQLADGGIVFDYRLRPGPAGTKTAIRILQQEDFPPTLLARARELMGP